MGTLLETECTNTRWPDCTYQQLTSDKRTQTHTLCSKQPRKSDHNPGRWSIDCHPPWFTPPPLPHLFQLKHASQSSHRGAVSRQHLKPSHLSPGSFPTPLPGFEPLPNAIGWLPLNKQSLLVLIRVDSVYFHIITPSQCSSFTGSFWSQEEDNSQIYHFQPRCCPMLRRQMPVPPYHTARLFNWSFPEQRSFFSAL